MELIISSPGQKVLGLKAALENPSNLRLYQIGTNALPFWSVGKNHPFSDQ
jgi:hypothetical protein